MSKKSGRRRYIKSADEIRQTVRGSGFVEEQAYDILLVIEQDIERAIENKKDSAITEIATNIDIPPMKRLDAQRAVYYKILKELRDSGYTPRIEIRGTREGEQQVFIHTTWRTELDETQDQVMDNFIKQHSILDTTKQKEPGSRRRRA